MFCPKCYYKEDPNPFEAIDLGTHFMCSNPNCRNEKGERTQFELVIDKAIRFPYNVIFKGRPIEQFYRKPYITITSPGLESLGYRDYASEEDTSEGL